MGWDHQRRIVKVREAGHEDVEAIRAVHRESIMGLGPAAYDREQVEAWAWGVKSATYAAIEDVDVPFLVAESDGEVVGFGSLRLEAPGGYEADVDAEVTAVYVRPPVARQGVGSAILDALERLARERGVRTLGLSASLPAVDFYEAHGYERVREYAHEFSAGESTGVEGAVVEMKRDL